MEAGVDLSTVEFVEIALPDIRLALQEGRVDAGHTGEPFVTVAEQQGNRVIADSYEAIEEGLDISSWFTTDTFLEQSPDVAGASSPAWTPPGPTPRRTPTRCGPSCPAS